MRNLKRALSLALASVMLVGMMVVGSSAASFPDVDSNDNIEAIDVLETVEVMIGNENGDFEPDKNVTRAEMAVVMAKLLNLDYKYYETTCPFNDVPDWAKGWVGACAANGIVSGRGEGVYDPNATVTAVEAASMMMRALGYFQNAEDYDKGFEASTVAQASRISLFSGIDGNARDPMNRNQVAQLALNTLEARMVEFTGEMGIEIPGVGNVGYNSKYDYRTGSESKYRAIAEDGGKDSVGSEGQYYVQLGEQLYNGNLKKAGDTDAFGAPATRWSYKNTEIGKYANEADLTYTSEVKIKDIYKDLGLSSEPNTNYYEDGVSKTEANDGTTNLGNLTDKTSDGQIGDAKIGAKGSVTNVYYTEGIDRQGNTTRSAVVVITNYYLAKADADYDADDKEVDLTIYSDENSSLTVKDEDVSVSDVNKGDYLVVTIAEDKVMTAVPAETVAEVEISSARDKDYVVADKKYEYNGVSKSSSAALGNDYIVDSNEYSLKDGTYNLYLDPNGFVLGVEAVAENADVSDYLIITANSKENGYDLIAKAMFTDGTEETITISKIDGKDAKKSDVDGNDVAQHKFYTFRQKSNGKYELTTVQTIQSDNRKAFSPTNNGTGVNGGIDNKAQPIAGLNPQRAGTNSTVFIADGKVFTGVKNAPKVNETSDGIFYVLDKDGRLLIVWTAEKGKVQTSSDDLVYILNEEVTGIRKDSQDGDTYYLYKAFYQGKAVDDFAVNDDNIDARGLYEVDSYSDGRADLSRDGLVSKKAGSDNTYKYGKGITGISAKDNILTVTGSTANGVYMLADDVKIYTVDGETVKAVSADNLSTDRTITRGGFDTITIVREENDADADVIVVYLSKANESPNGSINKGDTVSDPTANDLKDAIGDGDDGSGQSLEVNVSGKVPEGTFGGSGTKLPTLNFKGETKIDGETVINGDSSIAGTTTISSSGSLETLAIKMKDGGKLVVENGGVLTCIDINVYNGNKIVWGNTEYTFSKSIYFHTSTSASKIKMTNTDTGEEVTTDAGPGDWASALEAAVTKGWGAKK